MDPEPIVFDISSDDDSYGRRDEPKGDDFVWLAEFLGVSDDGEKPSDDDSDDVVVLREVKASAKSKSKSSKPALTNENIGNDDDDDCVVLDGDPDEPVVDDSGRKDDSDELLIVAEKGQVACRDFPHSRHLCASFPFGTTPHEKHCNLCHCYVCDKPAPCALWVATSTGFDHCHATDKEDAWKAQRRNLKSGKHALPKPVPKLPEASNPVGLLQRNQVSAAQHHQVLPHSAVRLPASSRLQNHVPRNAAPLQGCSSTNFTTPTILSRSRSPQLGVTPPKFKFQPRVVTGGQFHGANNNIQTVRGSQPVGNLGNSFVLPNPAASKRPGILRFPWPARNQSTRNQPIPFQPHRNPTPVPVAKNLNPMRWENVSLSAHQSSSLPNLGASALNVTLASSQHEFMRQPVPTSANSQNFFQLENQFQTVGPIINPSGNEICNPIQNPSPGVRTVDSVSYNPGWVSNALDNTGQSNYQQQPPLVDPFQLQGPLSSSEPSAKECNPQGSSKNTNNLSSDFDIDRWILENPSVPVVPDGSTIPQSNNIYSPENAALDILFDFETSWNELTHA